jgi:hypothetical protein
MCNLQDILASVEKLELPTGRLAAGCVRLASRLRYFSAMIMSGEDVVDNNGNGASAGSMRFKSVLQADVPKGRDGKHKQIILRLLDDIGQLSEGLALKVPLAELPDTKENIRSALNRAARQKKIDLATSSDSEFLYVWKSNKDSSAESE